MLDILRTIVSEINASSELAQSLEIVVQRLKRAMGVEVCSIYLSEPDSGSMILMASDGLNKEAISKVRLLPAEGLVGMVVERAEPLNLANAAEHPRYLFLADTGEEEYQAFLGVPIIHQRQVLGVLVIQRNRKIKFGEDIVTLLVTIAAQISGAIAHARAVGGLDKIRRKTRWEGRPLRGQPGAPGVAVGKAYLLDSLWDIEKVPDKHCDSSADEQERFLDAVKLVKQSVTEMIDNLNDNLPSADSAIFSAYLMMLDSDSLIGSTLDHIREGNWAPGALRETVMEHIRIFDEMEDAYLRERAEDVRDLGQRILHVLLGEHKAKKYPKNTILVGEEVSASMLAEVPPKRLRGVVSVRGSRTSHTAILARALGVPAVMGVEDIPLSQIDDCEMIADGYSGVVFFSPTDTVKKEYRRLKKEEDELAAGLQKISDLPAETTDGRRIPLYANTGLLSDIRPSLNSGAEGIGLYRTEFPFMMRDRFPGEQEQYRLYRQVLKSFHPRPVTMRTLDVGGDKSLPYFPIEEENPFLGWRGIRITLDHPEIFLSQIRAMLRASKELENLQILLPMVSGINELDEAMGLIFRAHNELVEEGEGIPLPNIGAMIEIPSAVYQAEAIAKRVDFLSIGSNDLTQYMLAVDRNNPRVAALYDAMHPAVLQAIYQVVRAAKKHNTPVSVCGELAGDPMAVLLLLAMGISSLSMSASSIIWAKWVIRSFSHRRCKTILDKVMGMERPGEIREYLIKVLDKEGLAGLVRAGKR